MTTDEINGRSCRHCHASLAGKRGGAWFCSAACAERARLRRMAGRPEDYLNDRGRGGRRGRLPLAAVTRFEALAEARALREAVR